MQRVSLRAAACSPLPSLTQLSPPPRSLHALARSPLPPNATHDAHFAVLDVEVNRRGTIAHAFDAPEQLLRSERARSVHSFDFCARRIAGLSLGSGARRPRGAMVETALDAAPLRAAEVTAEPHLKRHFARVRRPKLVQCSLA